jgi:DNA-binding IclR family transcriptional regulator
MAKQSPTRVLYILDALARAGGDLSMAELAELTRIPEATLQRTIQLLVDEGYVLKDASRQRLQVGARSLELANAITTNVPFAPIVRTILREIASLTGETAVLYRYLQDRGQAAAMAYHESGRELQYEVSIGELKPLHAGASGKAILAFLEPATRVDILARRGLAALTDRTVTDPAILERELDGIRKVGFAISRGEYVVGAVGIAAPVRSRHGDVYGSLVVTVPEPAFEASRLTMLSGHVRAAAAKFSRCLGYVDPSRNDAIMAAE